VVAGPHRNAPTGSESCLSARSVRGGRPSTDDSVVEAIDEETPDLVGNSRSRTIHSRLRILPGLFHQPELIAVPWPAAAALNECGELLISEIQDG
jgi:hypothetical protein